MMVDTNEARMGHVTSFTRALGSTSARVLVKSIMAETGDIVRPSPAPMAPATPMRMAAEIAPVATTPGRTAWEKATLGAVPDPLMTARPHVITGLRMAATVVS